jgi:hypothetical protein
MVLFMLRQKNREVHHQEILEMLAALPRTASVSFLLR